MGSLSYQIKVALLLYRMNTHPVAFAVDDKSEVADLGSDLCFGHYDLPACLFNLVQYRLQVRVPIEVHNCAIGGRLVSLCLADSTTELSIARLGRKSAHPVRSHLHLVQRNAEDGLVEFLCAVEVCYRHFEPVKCVGVLVHISVLRLNIEQTHLPALCKDAF